LNQKDRKSKLNSKVMGGKRKKGQGKAGYIEGGEKRGPFEVGLKKEGNDMGTKGQE